MVGFSSLRRTFRDATVLPDCRILCPPPLSPSGTRRLRQEQIDPNRDPAADRLDCPSPFTIMWWIVGGNTSGRNLTVIPLRIFFTQIYGYGLAFVERKNGGMFSLTHLWFLYYLLLIYILFIGAYLVIKRVMPNGVGLSERTDRMMARCMSSPWSVLSLSLATGVFLWPMDGWLAWIPRRIPSGPPSRSLSCTARSSLLGGF